MGNCLIHQWMPTRDRIIELDEDIGIALNGVRHCAAQVENPDSAGYSIDTDSLEETIEQLDELERAAREARQTVAGALTEIKNGPGYNRSGDDS